MPKQCLILWADILSAETCQLQTGVILHSVAYVNFWLTFFVFFLSIESVSLSGSLKMHCAIGEDLKAYSCFTRHQNIFLFFHFDLQEENVIFILRQCKCKGVSMATIKKIIATRQKWHNFVFTCQGVRTKFWCEVWIGLKALSNYMLWGHGIWIIDK